MAHLPARPYRGNRDYGGPRRMSDFNVSAGALPGINVSWLFRSSLLGITLWNCSAGRRELSEERHQAWHVVSFVHSGAFVLHARGRSAVIDATAVLLLIRRQPFSTLFP